MKKSAAIFTLFVLTTLAFSQTLQPIELFHLSSTRNLHSRGGYFGPFRYNYVGQDRMSDIDSVLIYALRIEFRPDSDINTTGNGLFMRASLTAHENATDSISNLLGIGSVPLSRTDRKEFAWYALGADRGPYRFDRLPRDRTYFSEHLTSLRNYFLEVSNGNIRIGHKIFPDGDFAAFRLSSEMARYSPGVKRRDETDDQFYTRRARALMAFVSQSIAQANNHAENPFADLRMDRQREMIVNKDNIPVFFLIIHAGASALTDDYGDSPSDLTATFVGEELFNFFSRDATVFGGRGQAEVETYTVGARTRTGAKIKTGDTTVVVPSDIWGEDTVVLQRHIHLSEIMMVSETANQDSVNFGINGVLVNQFARQIGIPDLFSTTTGSTGIGRFGIMDFAGYVAGQGFIPPNPSAFTRSFMGWETPTVALPESRHELTVGRNNLVLVPINSTEYYLIENRQRNLTGNRDLFVFDSIHFITEGFHVNLQANVDSATSRGVVMRVKSRDIGIPASGAVVWHIDEKLIGNRLGHNVINSDLEYRAVRLVEADGVQDIGREFSTIFGSSWWDYGSAADVFPHTNIFQQEPPVTINTMSPSTSPATTANDGGNTFLRLNFANSRPTAGLPREEYHLSRAASGAGRFRNYTVINFSDTTIILTVGHDDDARFLSPHPQFPVRVAGNGFFPLLTADIFGENDIVALSKDGYLSIVPASGDTNNIRVEKIDNPVNMPSFIERNLFVPALNRVFIYRNVLEGNVGRSIQSTEINANISTHVLGLDNSGGGRAASWVFGTSDGRLFFGGDRNTSDTVTLNNNNSPISAIAKYDDVRVAAVSENGAVFLVSRNGASEPFVLPTNNRPVFSPFKIAVSGNNIFVADNRQGLWFLTYCDDDERIKLHENWRGRREQAQLPIDWAGAFREQAGREHIPQNNGFLSMANLAADGNLHLILGGTNGIWAFDEKGNLLENYPAILDRSQWWIRESILATPATAKTTTGETMVFFTTTTGDTRSWYMAQVTRTDPNRGIVWFNDFHNRPDSLTGLSQAQIDTILRINGGIIEMYFAPGGLIDVRHGRTGKRPDLTVSTALTGNRRIYPYLTSIGDPLSQGVVLAPGGNTLYLTAISDNGMLHRFGLPSQFPADESNIDMTGGNAMRQFNFAPFDNSAQGGDKSLEYFYSYPNPVRILRNQNATATFRYKLGENASSVRLTIYTIQGQRVFDERNLRNTKGVNEFVLSSHDLSRFGSAVYRARLEVKFGNEEKVLFWKMAVLR